MKRTMKPTGSHSIKGEWVTVRVKFPNGTVVKGVIFKHDINPRLLSPYPQYGRIFAAHKSKFETTVQGGKKDGKPKTGEKPVDGGDPHDVW